MSDGGPDVARDGQVDERFRALMEGLRTTLPGVQVLFAFLLTLPLQARFADLPDLETVTYFVALVTAAVASVLLISPSAHQRARARVTGLKREHESHLAVAARLANIGTASFLIALTASVYLAVTVIFTAAWAAAPAAAIALVAGWAWFYLPLVSWRHDRGNDDGDG
ncbi:MAG: DUF6328 family protein [Acidimicrobiia bacterium]|nr:DUF6328 family protein [Acidimicrobiia bacterium]